MAIEFRIKAMDLWFRQLPGSMVVAMESAKLAKILSRQPGNHILQIGGPSNLALVKASPIAHKVFMGPQVSSYSERSQVQMTLDELPLLPNSIDVILLAHLIEFVNQPQRVFQDLYNALAPGGRLILLSFNPWSLWGWTHFVKEKKGFPWQGYFFSGVRLRRWLRESGYRIISSQTACFRPPLSEPEQEKRWLFLEVLGPIFASGVGGVSIIMAQKQRAGMTPIQEHWWSKKLAVNHNGYIKPTVRNVLKNEKIQNRS